MRIIRAKEKDLLDQFLAQLVARSVALDAELMARVTAIIDDVRLRGDQALIEYTARFDGVELRPSELRITEAQLREFASRTDERVIGALRIAIRNVRRFHEQQVERSWAF